MNAILIATCLLCFVQMCNSEGLTDADILDIHKMTLRCISNDLNGDIMAYIFSSEEGDWVELRPSSDNQCYVVVSDNYDLAKSWSLGWPYRNTTVQRNGKLAKGYLHICALLRQTIEGMKASDQRAVHLRYLVDRMEGKAAGRARDTVGGGFGIKFGPDGGG